MPQPLKQTLFSENQFNNFTEALSAVLPNFKQQKFLNLIFNKTWNKLELKERMRHTTNILNKFLPDDFRKSANLLIKTAKYILKELDKETGFIPISLADYIEIYGIEHFNISVKAIEEITKLASCEFAVRPFIIKYKHEMMKQMLVWSEHEHQNVRRLASEGCRSRLPWAAALPEFKKDPSLILPILENLKNDDSEFVRKSVANNLNDISKDNPETALEIFRKWKGFSKNTDKIVKHACRTLLKAGMPEAMKLFGYASIKDISLKDFKLEKQNIKIGEYLNFSFEISNISSKKIIIRLEYAIYFLRTNGKLNKKVFNISEKEYSKHSTSRVKKKHNFKIINTRKYYPGKQKISIIINGKELGIKDFILVD